MQCYVREIKSTGITVRSIYHVIWWRITFQLDLFLFPFCHSGNTSLLLPFSLWLSLGSFCDICFFCDCDCYSFGRQMTKQMRNNTTMRHQMSSLPFSKQMRNKTTMRHQMSSPPFSNYKNTLGHDLIHTVDNRSNVTQGTNHLFTLEKNFFRSSLKLKKKRNMTGLENANFFYFF